MHTSSAKIISSDDTHLNFVTFDVNLKVAICLVAALQSTSATSHECEAKPINGFS